MLGVCDQESLLGWIELHADPVGGWFLAHQNLLSIDPNAPIWLVGPGGPNANPMGELIGILSLSVIGSLLIRSTKPMHPRQSALSTRDAERC